MRGGSGFAWAVLAVLVLSPGRGLAHDPMSSWGVLRVRPDGLELTVVLAPVEAKYLLPDADPEQVVIDDATFAALHERLQVAAGRLYILSIGEEVIAPVELEAVFTPENDIEFRARYPRPDKGRLRLHAGYLVNMSAEHSSFLTVLDERDRMLGGFAPFADDPDSFVNLPARAAASSPPPIPATAPAGDGDAVDAG